MKKVENWMNVAASVGVLLGIIFLGLEIRLNTEMMRSQTRDSITDKQMMFSEWVATEPDMAVALVAASEGIDNMEPEQRMMYVYFMSGVWREWENSHYQFQEGLFEAAEFSPRMERWRSSMLSPAARMVWATSRDWYAPNFRAVVDGFVAEIEGGSGSTRRE